MCRTADDYNNVEPQHQCGVRHVPTGLHLSGIALPGEPQEIPMQAEMLGCGIAGIMQLITGM